MKKELNSIFDKKLDEVSSIQRNGENSFVHPTLPGIVQRYGSLHVLEQTFEEIKEILSKQIFPLTAHLNTSFYHERTIYVGDAAHSFHPIAGQGWNLGMKDVENLFNLIIKYKLF